MIWSVILWPAFFRSVKHSVCKLIGCDMKIDKWLKRKARTQRYWNGWSGEMKSFASGLETIITPTSRIRGQPVCVRPFARAYPLTEISFSYLYGLPKNVVVLIWDGPWNLETVARPTFQLAYRYKNLTTEFPDTMYVTQLLQLFYPLFSLPPKENSPFLRQATV